MKKLLIKLLISEENLYSLSGNIAERFYDVNSGDFDVLREKMFYWLKCGIYK